MLYLVFANHRLDDCFAVFFRVGIKKRYMLFGAALAFEVYGQQVGTACHQYPQDAPAISRVAHRPRELGKYSRVNARITSRIARAERGVRFVYQNYGRKRL